MRFRKGEGLAQSSWSRSPTSWSRALPPTPYCTPGSPQQQDKSLRGCAVGRRHLVPACSPASLFTSLETLDNCFHFSGSQFPPQQRGAHNNTSCSGGSCKGNGTMCSERVWQDVWKGRGTQLISHYYGPFSLGDLSVKLSYWHFLSTSLFLLCLVVHRRPKLTLLSFVLYGAEWI